MTKDLNALISKNELAQERFKDLEEYFGSSKSILEDREEFKKWLERGKQNTKKVDELESKLEQQPSEEAIKYLECNDIDVQKFTEAMKKQRLQVIKPNICDDCVSRQAVVEYIKACGAELGDDIENEFVREDIQALPPVTPIHGTCKDCFYYNIDEDGHGYHCEKYGYTRFPVYADFYCKDFEKRGNENDC